jgi:alpha-glucosidase (family GH31 glycosyl hydrolase)
MYCHLAEAPAPWRAQAAIEPVAKKYAKLRYQLMPYTYTLAREAYDTGMPLMRALWLYYPDDKQALGQSQESYGAATC